MNITEEARNLARRNRGQMTAEEYETVGRAIKAVAPANIVVFGAGRDTKLWCRINHSGRTLIFEDDPKWIPKGVGEPYLVSYTPSGCVDGLPDILPAVALVLVDGPKGYRPEHPGRFGSIRVAAAIRGENGSTVLVHDCHRPSEQQLSLSHLGEPDRKVHHLWIWERRCFSSPDASAPST